MKTILTSLVCLFLLYSCQEKASYSNEGNNETTLVLRYSLEELIKPYLISNKSVRYTATCECYYEKFTNVRLFSINDFVECFEKTYPSEQIIKLFDLSKCKNLKMNSSNQQVIEFLEDEQKLIVQELEEQIRTRVSKMTASTPEIISDLKKGQITLHIKGIKDVRLAIGIMNSSADLEFYEVYFMTELDEFWQQAIKKCDEFIFDETDSLAEFKPVRGLDELLFPHPFAIGCALKQDQEQISKLLNQPEIRACFPEDIEFMWAAKSSEIEPNKQMFELYAIKKGNYTRVNSNDVVESAASLNDYGSYVVNIAMSEEGTEKWKIMTRNNIDRMIALTLDDKVYSAPRVMGEITQGSTEISGSFTMDEAKDLASIINVGNYKIPLIIEAIK